MRTPQINDGSIKNFKIKWEVGNTHKDQQDTVEIPGTYFEE